MPYLLIKTNRHINEDEKSALLRRCSQTLEEMLGKPERYIMVGIEGGAAMMFGGEESPCAYVELKSLGLPEARSADFSKALCTLLGEALSLPPDRIYIEFSSPARHLWGWNNGTF